MLSSQRTPVPRGTDRALFWLQAQFLEVGVGTVTGVPMSNSLLKEPSTVLFCFCLSVCRTTAPEPGGGWQGPSILPTLSRRSPFVPPVWLGEDRPYLALHLAQTAGGRRRKASGLLRGETPSLGAFRGALGSCPQLCGVWAVPHHSGSHAGGSSLGLYTGKAGTFPPEFSWILSGTRFFICCLSSGSFQMD